MNRKSLLLVGLSLATVFAAVSACSSSSEDTPTRPPITNNDAGPVDSGSETIDAPVDANTCFDWDAGTPTVLDDFLNACTDGQCSKFDNAARVPQYVPGQPLPPVP